jgi:phosphoribosylanthranilate isomerase
LHSTKNKFDLIQLHGDESPGYCSELKNGGFSIVKAFAIDSSWDLRMLRDYDCVDFFLFDTKGPNYGGNARTFDWEILERYDQSKPYFLSGGISSKNIARALDLRHLNIHAIDVNSGVEDSPGQKSVEKIEEIIEVIHNKKIV